jgi:hypothetical protein
MTAPDLAAARQQALEFLVDACTITRDPQGFEDDTIDPDTLELTRPGGDSGVVYEGACLIGAGTDAPTEAGGQILATGHRQVRLPFDAPLPLVGDSLTITAVGPQSDPGLVDAVYRVVSAEPKSMYVTRLIEAERTTVTA